MTQRLLLLLALLLFSCARETPPAPAERASAESLAFEALLDDHWALTLSANPVLAVQMGDTSGYGKLSDSSLEAYSASIAAKRVLLDRLRAIEPSGLTDDEQLNRQLLLLELSADVEAEDHPGKYLLFTTYSAPHLSLARLAETTVIRSATDAESYVNRLKAMPQYMDAVIERLEAGVEAGWTQPCEALEGFERTYRTHIVEDVENSVFMAPLAAAPAQEAAALWKDEAYRTIEDRVIPAFKAFGTFYESRYTPACRAKVGVGSLEGGQAFYAYRARIYTTTDMTPDEIHNIGLQEVVRIRSEMEAVAAEAGFDRLKDFQQKLRTDTEYYPKTAAERIAAASTISKKMDGKLVELFTVLPRMPYDIRSIPLDVAEGTTTAYYSQPAADGTRPGTYWVNTTRLSTRPLYELEALSLHEAVPGHHLQIALSHELDLPNFRRFGGFTAFTEGWGLYSERLGLEVGFYETPETNFGRLSYEMWRACRLVVDTGMHAKGWTRQEAIDFMLKNTGLSRNNIEREVDRYITWPGQALAYKIGELKIRELRARAEAQLGDSFDVRRFHDKVLSQGALPLSILEEEIDAWIESEKVSSGGMK